MTLKHLQAFRDKLKSSFEVKVNEDWVWNGENSIQVPVPNEEATFEQFDELLKEIDAWIEETFK